MKIRFQLFVIGFSTMILGLINPAGVVAGWASILPDLIKDARK